ncbi:hypothetical protein [Nocardia sp. NPDC057227]|uniref:hypothetical protein n=1 Tax=Nocardia sp. NPDC057227 TaxID=3346056 RepID=UPI00363E3781
MAALAGHVPRHHPHARLLYAVFLLANQVVWLNTDAVVSREGVDGSSIFDELGIRNFEDSAREKLLQVIATTTTDHPHAADYVALLVNAYTTSGVPSATRLYDKATDNVAF